ncbi:acyl-CoA thioester hydrolase [Desulfitispora alkaliphila]|uniref:acyl-CoA thioesterase n=1 Tax=Desulfitispora alkaliphila TaxID=622674 RepID=UPI003D25CFC1
MEKITQPSPEAWLEKFRFSTSIRTRFCETDAFGHINNVSYFIYFEQARVEYLRELALESEMLRNKEFFVVTADLYCQYLAELYFGDQLDVKLRATRVRNSSFDFEYAIVRPKDGKIAAAGRGAIVFMNRNTKKSMRIPEHLKEKLYEYEPDLQTEA